MFNDLDRLEADAIELAARIRALRIGNSILRAELLSLQRDLALTRIPAITSLYN